VHPDAQPKCAIAGYLDLLDLVQHAECHLGHRGGVILARRRDAAHDHIGIADRLDLLEPEPVGRGQR
jgi:hypothetical protein